MIRTSSHWCAFVVVTVSSFWRFSLVSSSNHETFGKLECTSGQSVCPDFSHCIPSNFFCDGRKDCDDGSDERRTFCFYRNFTCGDGKQIRSWLRCNGRKECPDGSDEENCDTRTNGSQRTTLTFASSFNLPLETITESETFPSTSITPSTTPIADEKTTTTFKTNSSSHESKNIHDPLPADRLSEKMETVSSSEFLKPFTFWSAIVIGSLVGLALVTIVILRISAFFKKPRIKSILLESGEVSGAQHEEDYLAVIYYTVPLSKLPNDVLRILSHDQK